MDLKKEQASFVTIKNMLSINNSVLSFLYKKMFAELLFPVSIGSEFQSFGA